MTINQLMFIYDAYHAETRGTSPWCLGYSHFPNPIYICIVAEKYKFKTYLHQLGLFVQWKYDDCSIICHLITPYQFLGVHYGPQMAGLVAH